MNQVRHRLSRVGNRQINRVVHIMATVQLRNPTEGGAYFDRRKAEGKTSMEAMRALKRTLSKHCLQDNARRRDHTSHTNVRDGPGRANGTRL